MSKSEEGRKVKVIRQPKDFPNENIGKVGVVVKAPEYSPYIRVGNLPDMSGAARGEYYYFEADELELVGSFTKEEAFRKAVELSPNALLEDQLYLAEWLMK